MDKLDQTDSLIVEILQEDSNLSNAALATKVDMKPSTVRDRVKRLERRGIIRGYVALVDAEKLGKPILAFIRLIVGATPDFSKSKQNVADVCAEESDVLEWYSLAGEDDYLLKVRAANTRDLERLIERIRSKAQISNSISSIVLSSYKEFPILQTPSNSSK